MTTGVTATGFVPKTVVEILADIETDELSLIDPQLDVSPEEPIGQLNGIMAEKLAELWELGGVAYNGLNRDNAEGPQLANIGGLTGTPKLPASPSIAKSCSLVFSIAGTYVAGSLVANVNGQPSVQFSNGADVVVASPGTVTGVTFIALLDGPTVANAGTLTQITTPVAGWTSITNTLDAIVGTNVETDTAYRTRQEEELTATGSSTVDGIRADLLRVQGVISVEVIENTTLVFDPLTGTPPKALQAIVWDGLAMTAANNDIAQALWDDKPSGIQAFGLSSGVAVDSNNVNQTVFFTRPSQVSVYQNVIVTAPGIPDATIAPLVKAALASLGQSILKPGAEMFALAFQAAALNVPGVVDVPQYLQGFSSMAVFDSNLVPTVQQVLVVDTSRMLVNGL